MTAAAPATSTLAHNSHRNHVVHRLAHAIYGLIVLAAVVGDLSTHDDDLRTAIVLVGAGGAVLVVAHSYSQLVAAASMYSEMPRSVIVSTVVDQLALAIPAAAAVAVFALGEAEIISADLAYDIVIVGSLVTLFVLGVTIGFHRKKGVAWSIAVGVGNLAVGLIIIGIEAAAAH